jgi:hypothetical protein
MPYIKQALRPSLSAVPIAIRAAADAGELNYVLTTAVLRFLNNGAPSYSRYNAAIGALECCKLELYRRMIAKYEDTKIIENGDVYDTR